MNAGSKGLIAALIFGLVLAWSPTRPGLAAAPRTIGGDKPVAVKEKVKVRKSSHRKLNIKKPSQGLRAFYRSDHLWRKTRNPATDRIPAGAMGAEQALAARLPVAGRPSATSRSTAGATEVRSPALTANWSVRGPLNASGRILALAYDRADERVIVAGSASGGVWRSADSGRSWVKTTPGNLIQSASCLAQDPRPGRTDVWYYGTGELLSTTDRRLALLPRTVGYGQGIYKSTDGARSWTQLAATADQSAALSQVFSGLWRVAVDPVRTDKDIVYAAGLGAVVRSEDGGASWSKCLGDLAIKSFCTDVAVAGDGVVWAALGTFTTDAAALIPRQTGVFRSTDGLTWTEATPPDFYDSYRTIKLAPAPSDPNVIYVLAEAPISDNDWVFGFTSSRHSLWKGIWDPVSQKVNWEDRSANLPGGGAGSIIQEDIFNSIGGYALTIKVKPDDPDAVFIGGTNLYRSVSGFAQPDSVILGGYPYDFVVDNLHPDMHDVAFPPSDPEAALVACDGGIYRTEQNTAETVTWSHLNNGLLTSQFYSVAVDPTAPGDSFLVGGLQDNSFYYTASADPVAPWTPAVGGDGLWTAVGPGRAFVLGSIYNGQLFSFTVDDLGQPVNLVYQTPSFLSVDDFNFFTNFALDPVDHKTFYLPAKNRLWRKADIGVAILDETKVDAGWAELTGAALPENESITALGLSVVPAGRLYYGSDQGRVFRIDGAGAEFPTVTEITDPLFPKGGFTACIDVDQAEADDLLVVFSNYGVRSIFHSTDGGESWVEVGGNLEQAGGPSIRWAARAKAEPGPVYLVGTSIGLYSTASLEGDLTVWAREAEDNIGPVIVEMILVRQSDGLVAVATQGAGVHTGAVNRTR